MKHYPNDKHMHHGHTMHDGHSADGKHAEGSEEADGRMAVHGSWSMNDFNYEKGYIEGKRESKGTGECNEEHI